MNKPHKYIKVSDYTTGEVETRLNPEYLEYLEMFAEKYEKSKPREFEDREWYPAVNKSGRTFIMWYDQEERKFWNGPYKEDPDCFYWVGDKLEIQWPNTI